jgi:hypothetical protein
VRVQIDVWGVNKGLKVGGGGVKKLMEFQRTAKGGISGKY